MSGVGCRVGLLLVAGAVAQAEARVDLLRQSRRLVNVERHASNFAVLNLAQDCSSAAPCLARFGSRVVSLLQSATVALGGTASGMSLAYIYVAPSGLLTVGHNAPAGDTVACSSGCTVVSGVTQFPENAIPLFTWSMTWTAGVGRWDAQGGSDKRALLSTKTLVAGPGIQIADVMGESAIGVNTAVVGLRVAVPATARSACVAGSYAGSETHHYFCVQPDTWVRWAVGAW